MSVNVTLRQLRAFCSVGEVGSFTEAAKRLHLSQAALSGLMKELEHQLGVTLLNRNTRHVSLSTVGEAFLPLSRRVLDDLDEALGNINNLKEMRRGVVCIAAPEVLSCTLLPELIAKFGERYPNIDVKFIDVPIESVFARLENGEIDLGIAPSVDTGQDLNMHPLVRSPFWVALRKDDPLAKKRSLTWADVRSRTVITFMRQFTERVLSNVPEPSRPLRVLEVQRINTTLSMIKVRGGVTMCPQFTRPLVDGFQLAFLPLRDPVVTRGVSAFSRPGIAPSPAVSAFLEFTIEFSRQWADSA